MFSHRWQELFVFSCAWIFMDCLWNPPRFSNMKAYTCIPEHKTHYSPLCPSTVSDLPVCISQTQCLCQHFSPVVHSLHYIISASSAVSYEGVDHPRIYFQPLILQKGFQYLWNRWMHENTGVFLTLTARDHHIA